MSAGKVKEEGQQARAGLAGMLLDIRQQLRFQQAMGIAEYPLNEDVRRFLQGPEPRPGRPTPAGSRRVSGAPTSPPRPETTVPGPAILEALKLEIGQCSLCPLAAGRLGTVPGRGSAGSRLMVVGDWSAQGQEFNPGILFGPEEDGMLWRMMEAIALPPEEVYVTNILKCCPAPGQVPDRSCRDNCFSYLRREIGAVRPRLICAMGELAARMLTESREPLFRLRGRFMIHRNQATEELPVMPTFHPRYLLANPDMKKAAWQDLQAIRRRLDQPGV